MIRHLASASLNILEALLIVNLSAPQTQTVQSIEHALIASVKILVWALVVLKHFVTFRITYQFATALNFIREILLATVIKLKRVSEHLLID